MRDERRGRATPSQARDTGAMPRTGVVARAVDGRYRLLERLGGGATNVVYRAEDVLLERITVIKTLVGEGDGRAASIERFTKDARALARLSHGNVAQIHAYGVYESAPFLAMEYVAGESLALLIEGHALRGQRVEIEQALAIARGAAAGLDAMHARGIVHGNVEPGSILIEGGTGRPVLVGFALLARDRASNTVPAPDGAEEPSSRAPTDRDDVHAFARTLFELLTGREAFPAEADATPPRVSSVVPRLRSFDAALLRAMSEIPSDRHATCEELVAELDAAMTVLRGIEPVRAIVQTTAESARRRLVRYVGEALSVLRRPIVIDCVSTYDDVVTALAARPAQIVVLDTVERSAESHAAVLGVRTTSPDAHVVVLAADWNIDDELLGDLGARRLPKPMVEELARSFFGAAAAMIATAESP